jgi:hypothetical protein
MDVQNVLARNVFVHKSLVAVLHRWRWECSTSGGCAALAAMGMFHQWWLCCTGGGCVALVVAVELSVVSLE